MKIIELSTCEFCKNTGVHISPDVSTPVLIQCANKNCGVVKLIELATYTEEILGRSVNCPNCDPEVGFVCEFCFLHQCARNIVWKYGHEDA